MAENSYPDIQIRRLFWVILSLAALLVARLFWLQIIQHDYYATFALDTHEIYKKLYPSRGEVYLKDERTGEETPIVVNRQYYDIFAVPKEVTLAAASSTATTLADMLHYNSAERNTLFNRLANQNSQYAPVQKKVSDATMDLINQAQLPGVHAVSTEYRYYPENNLASTVLGFYGLDKDGARVGLYGLEGYWQTILAGQNGFTQGSRGADGSWISVAGRTTKDAENGADVLLTIDRAIEFAACERLRAGLKEYDAKSAALVMMNPKTGAIIAMCSYPDFNPNEYSKTNDISAFNNQAIFTAYEPGSVFKPIVMSMALDLNIVRPNTTFTDPCERKINNFTIHNALDKCYGLSTMTQVLEESINTGMMWVEEQMEDKQFYDYAKKFGFGERTGVDLDTEATGDLSTLTKPGQIYGAVASFGQGITATPIQIATAYSALANQGQMPKPFVVAEVRYPSGKIDKTEPVITGRPITPRTAKLVSGMLVSVIENGHGKKARFNDYYIAGKTGTAQIAGKGGYTEETNHTFAGFAPASDPEFVLVVKYEAPQRLWAESTVLPVFKDIINFTLNYYAVRNDR
ncbi:MAG: penicillin-binding protein 2 [bacterium]|nr:penicillin-binding protein 2 [bacterium]